MHGMKKLSMFMCKRSIDMYTVVLFGICQVIILFLNETTCMHIYVVNLVEKMFLTINKLKCCSCAAYMGLPWIIGNVFFFSILVTLKKIADLPN